MVPGHEIKRGTCEPCTGNYYRVNPNPLTLGDGAAHASRFLWFEDNSNSDLGSSGKQRLPEKARTRWPLNVYIYTYIYIYIYINIYVIPCRPINRRRRGCTYVYMHVYVCIVSVVIPPNLLPTRGRANPYKEDSISECKGDVLLDSGYPRRTSRYRRRPGLLPRCLFWSAGHALAPSAQRRFLSSALSFCGVRCMT